MDIQIQKLNCDRCGKVHEIEIDFDSLTEGQKKGIEPVLNSFICPNVKRSAKLGSIKIKKSYI